VISKGRIEVKRKWHLRAQPEKPDAREVDRESYRPARVRLLFIGEAPPASGRFFYHADSGLYRAMRTAFITAIPVLENGDFLKQFQDLGCYLVDLCETAVDRLDKDERVRTCKESEARLAGIIKLFQHSIIISLARSISMNVNRALQQAQWVGPHVNLPYPGRWRRYRISFEKALVPILRRELSVADPVRDAQCACR